MHLIVNFTLLQLTKALYGELMYSSTLSLSSALDEGRWSTPRLGNSTPLGKTRYPLYRRLGGPQGRSGQVRKVSP